MLAGDGKLRIALGSTSGSEFDSLCQPSTTYTDDNGRGTVNGVKCTQGVTLHLTYHTSSVPASKCNAADPIPRPARPASAALSPADSSAATRLAPPAPDLLVIQEYDGCNVAYTLSGYYAQP